MGYRGTNSFDERDKLFGAQTGDRNASKKNLNDLFSSKSSGADACAQGHAWIRDWDRQFKCSRCKTLKPDQSARL